MSAGIEVTPTSGSSEDATPILSDRFGLLSGEIRGYEEVGDDTQVLVEVDARQGDHYIDHVKQVWSDTADDTEGLQIEITASSIDISSTDR